MADSDNPSFTCYSGELLWGQLHCIVEGYLSNKTDNQCTVPSPVKGGTIIQENYKYRVKATRGQWDVREIHSRLESGQPSFLSGFIVFNRELVDPVNIIKSCTKGGMSNSQDGDKTIIYINRYDWSLAHEIPEVAEELLNGDVDDTDEPKIRQLMGKRLILVDASAGLVVINKLKQNVSGTAKNVLIKQNLVVENDSIGVHLSCPDTEYELGWIVYAPNQELVAFVYDASYNALEGELFLNDGRVIKTADE